MSPLNSRNTQVCKTWAAIIGSNVQLQFLIELGGAGMCDKPAGGRFTTHERIERFKALQSAWKDIAGATEHDYDDTAMIAYDLQQGILAQATIDLDYQKTVFNFHRLPSRFSEITPRSWSNEIPFDISDFVIDPSQDLLVTMDIPDGGPRRVLRGVVDLELAQRSSANRRDEVS
ncbi:hypothetical protein FRB97_003768 [Tulasnella sp. 331]|nr:hypothetical protein FRB97_003768 [Tulasnella sp. 331]